MSLVIADNLSLSYGKKVLFDGEDFSIGPRDRIGLIGANGTGKSSLLKILAGQLTADEGSTRLARGARLGYLPQDIATFCEGSLVDAVVASVPGRDDLERRLQSTQAGLEESQSEPEQLELSERLADLHAELDHFEERHGRHRAKRILCGLGFTELDFARSTAELSGGWRMRAALAGLLLLDPDLLLLDEPTNHLDLPTLAWFDQLLRRSSKALVLISHDRDFLNRQINRVMSLEVEGVRSYAGNYEDYLRQRSEEVEQLSARAERQATKRAQDQAFIDRFKAKASKARQAQSRMKRLEKEEIIQVVEERAKVRFSFPEVSRSGREVATFRGVRKSYGAKVIYEGLDAQLLRGQRVAVVGSNGAGKTTLLKLLAGELSADAGQVELGHNVVMGYYAQHHAEKLDPQATILEEIARLVPDKPQSFVRSVLGTFLFSADDVDKPTGVLSGGERARVALAKLLLVPANLMLMDEPTNHLDLDSSEALIKALKGYGGTLLFVSHNRSFLNQLATDVWDVRDRTVVPYGGNLDEYLEHLKLLALEQDEQDDLAAGASAEREPTRQKARRKTEAEERQRRNAQVGPLKKQIAALEARIASLESEQAQREAALADPVLYNDFAQARPLMDGHARGREELEELYAQWETASQKL